MGESCACTCVCAGLDASFESQERRSKIIGEYAFEFILISLHSFTIIKYSLNKNLNFHFMYNLNDSIAQLHSIKIRIFIGWKLHGGRWKGEYKCALLEDFKHVDLKTGVGLEKV